MTHPPHRMQRGFTLIEMLVAIVVMAILAAIAVPSFNSIVISSRLKTYSNDLVAALNLARSEAIKRSGRVVLCKSANGTACTNAGNWAQGWIVFVDGNNDAAVNAGEVIVAKQGALSSGFSLTGSANVANYLSFDAQGMPKQTSGSVQSGSFTLCPASPAPSGVGRSIDVSATGRPLNSSYGSCA